MIRKLISENFGGEAIPKIQKKIKIIKKEHYKYMAAFLANQVKGLKTSTTEINTPFGTVTVKKTGDSDCIIRKDGDPGDYKQLSNYLDANCLDEMVLTTIYKYLSMPYISSVTSIKEFNSKVDARISDDYLAVFCGILMVAEPLRFGDGGGHARGCIRKVYKLLKKESKPYSIVFGNEGDEFEKEKESMAVFAHKGRTDRQRDKSKSQPFAVGGKQQELNQLSTGTKQYESYDSIQDNAIRMHFFDEDISDDEDIKEEIYEAKCKLCHKFYKLGTKKDILLCDSCREKKEGENFLSLIENNQLEVAEQYCFLVKQNLTLAEHYYLLISKNQFDIAEIFIKLFKSYNDHSYSMNYYYLSLQNNPKY